MKNSIDEKTSQVIAAKSVKLFSGIDEVLKKIESNLIHYSSIVSNKTDNIETVYNQKICELKGFHIGTAISDFIIAGIVCFLLGIISTVFITQKAYKSMYKLTAKIEIESAKKDGIKEYNEQLVKSNSGLIQIYELKRDYIRNHKSFYTNFEDNMKNLDDQIKKMKDSPLYKDKKNR